MCDENSGRHAALIDTGSAILVTSVPLARQAPSTLLAFRPIASSATVAVHSVRPNSKEMEAGGLRCNTQIGRAHVLTTVTNAHLVCSHQLEKKKKKTNKTKKKLP